MARHPPVDRRPTADNASEGLQPCIKCKTPVSSEVQRCPACGKAFPHSRIVKYGSILLVVVGIPVIGFIGFVIYQSSAAKAANESVATPLQPSVIAEQPKPTPSTTAECRIKMTGSSGDVPVFPTAAGLDEYVAAAAAGDNDATAMAFRANSGFLVPAATRCFRVDVGVVKSKVRILDGDHRGETGWLPTEFTML